LHDFRHGQAGNPAKRDTVAAPDFDDTAFITESDAGALAARRGWRFQVQ